MEHQELVQEIIKALKEDRPSRWRDPDLHSAEHEFIKMLIAERKEKQARQERMKEKIAGSIILTTILGLITLIGAGALEWFRMHLK